MFNENAGPGNPSASSSDDETSQGAALEFLSFTLGREEYGIDIQSVQELRGYEAVTRIANAPDFMKGVMNLRGVIVPIIDMRMKFALGNAVYDQFTVVVILNVAGQTLGIVVDSVSDVITLKPAQIKPAPEIGSTIEASFIIGLAPLEERMLILIDIKKLMTAEDMGLQLVGSN